MKLWTMVIFSVLDFLSTFQLEITAQYMPAQWTGEVIKLMHLNRIMAKDLAVEAGLNPRYLSQVLNSGNLPEKARAKIEAALSRLISANQ